MVLAEEIPQWHPGFALKRKTISAKTDFKIFLRASVRPGPALTPRRKIQFSLFYARVCVFAFGPTDYRDILCNKPGTAYIVTQTVYNRGH